MALRVRIGISNLPHFRGTRQCDQISPSGEGETDWVKDSCSGQRL